MKYIPVDMNIKDEPKREKQRKIKKKNVIPLDMAISTGAKVSSQTYRYNHNCEEDLSR
jgi:hypothetical protein